MSIQVMQYEFLGPIRLSEWGPPMEEVVYIIMARDKDRFGIVYAGECKKTEKADFFVRNDRFKCWIKNAGSEENTYLAILPMFGSDDAEREKVLGRIVSGYGPACNK